MPNKVTRCIEEEYSLCLSYMWRRSAGWRPLLIYFRGPGFPFFVAPFLTILGLWRFARRPKRLADCELRIFEHAVVTRTCACLGSYGMGGPGFVGLRLRLASGFRTWIVFTIWAAAEWLTLDDALLEEGYFSYERSDPSRSFISIDSLKGAQLARAAFTADSVVITFTQNGASRHLHLQRDSSHLPWYRGYKQPKILSPSEDLQDAVVVSQCGNLWLED